MDTVLQVGKLFTAVTNNVVTDHQLSLTHTVQPTVTGTYVNESPINCVCDDKFHRHTMPLPLPLALPLALALPLPLALAV